MKIAVIGSGGREHALLWKLSKSDRAHTLYALPGNGGTGTMAENISVTLSDLTGLLNQCRDLRPDLVVVGPEAPLAAGVADFLARDGIPCFGPSARAARLESSKAYAKDLLQRNGILTAEFRVFDDFNMVQSFVKSEPYENGWVVKADGLAAGKGAIVCSSLDDVLYWSHEMLVKESFGVAGHKVVLERKLSGRESSTLFFCDGKSFIALPPAQDFKRAYDDDLGLNTGGMGSFCPTPYLSNQLLSKVEETIVQPVLNALAEEGSPYQGVLYVGLMLTADGPQVIEFNCRFGDPETQAILPIWQGDLPEIMLACAEGNLQRIRLSEQPLAHSVCVVLAAEGYPETYTKGIRVVEIPDTDQTVTFHAGTHHLNDQLISTGGRVLNAVGLGKTLSEARERAYELAQRLVVPGLRFRSDIAKESCQIP